MSLPAEQTIEGYQDTDILVTVTMQPTVDVTGWTMRVRVLDALGNVLLEKTTGGGGIVVASEELGIWQFVITPDDVMLGDPLPLGVSPWWFRRTDATSRGVIARGDLVLLEADA